MSDPGRRGVLWALALITLAGAVLRFATLDSQSFWFDEVLTVDAVLDPSLLGTIRGIGDTESNPPLYYVVDWFWTQAFGEGEVGLRSLSALAGTLTIPVGYAAAAALVSRRAGLIAAVLIAFNPMLVYFSQEGRSYALLALLAAASFLFFARAVRGGGGRDLAAWALFSAAAMATHYFAALLIAAEAAWLIARGPDRRRALIATAPLAAVAAALAPLALYQERETYSGWISKSPLGDRLRWSVEQLVLGPYFHVGIWLLPAALGVFALALVLCARDGPRSRPALWAAAIAGATIAASLLLAAAGSDFFVARNLIAVVVPLICVLAIAIATLRRAWAPALAALAALSLYASVDLQTDDFRQRADHRGAAEVLARWRPDLVVAAPLVELPLDHYLGAQDAGRTVKARSVVWLTEYGRPAKPPLPPSFRRAGHWRHGALAMVEYTSPVPRPLPLRLLIPNLGDDGDVLEVGPKVQGDFS